MANNYELYTSNVYYDDVLVTACLLIDDGKRMTLPENSFVNNSHPQTCVRLLSNQKVLFITVDGLLEKAQGMSLHELTGILESLGCKYAFLQQTIRP